MRLPLVAVATFVLLPMAALLASSDAGTGELCQDPLQCQVPCTDPRGCPDLVTDTATMPLGVTRVESFSTNSCDVREGMVKAGDREVMRFTFTTPNIGAGDLIVGRPADHPDWFVFSSCHNHYHFRWYADYRLWTPTGFVAWTQYRLDQPDLTPQQVLAQHPELLSEFVAGQKQGFCVIDVSIAPALPWGVPPPPDFPTEWTSCGSRQGIDRGWADQYIFTLPGQYIDVTDVPAGAYILEAEVNAERLYKELDYTNNRAFIPVAVTHTV